MKQPSVETKIEIDYTEKLTEIGTLLRDIFEEGTYYNNERKELCIKGCEDDLIVLIITLFQAQQAQMRDKVEKLKRYDSVLGGINQFGKYVKIEDVLNILGGKK